MKSKMAGASGVMLEPIAGYQRMSIAVHKEIA